jgi:hypothetical protein
MVGQASAQMTPAIANLFNFFKGITHLEKKHLNSKKQTAFVFSRK